MRTVLVVALTLAATSVAIAAAGPLGNADIVRLVQAGLSEEVILAKINVSATDFDTSTDALVKLGQAKVPNAVIKAMMARPGPAKTPPTEPRSTAAATHAGETPATAAAAGAAVPRGEVLLPGVYRTRGLCTAYGNLRATKDTLIFEPTKFTKVCEELFSKAEFELPFADMTEVCFEYAVSGTLAITLKDGHDFSIKETIQRVESVEKKLRAAHPELPFGCD